MPNDIYVIMPYRHAAMWVFDDPTVGLQAEHLVSGIPEMINVLIQSIRKGEKGLRLLFSARAFPGHQVELTRLRTEDGGMWYEWSVAHLEGWLCPALFKYFPEAPEKLYARAEPLSTVLQSFLPTGNRRPFKTCRSSR
ncbi:DUF6717 family protein [Nitrospira sp. Nam74]